MDGQAFALIFLSQFFVGVNHKNSDKVVMIYSLSGYYFLTSSALGFESNITYQRLDNKNNNITDNDLFSLAKALVC